MCVWQAESRFLVVRHTDSESSSIFFVQNYFFILFFEVLDKKSQDILSTERSGK